MNGHSEITRNTSQGGASGSPRAQDSEAVLRPPVDIYETAAGITLHADMPGVSKDRLEIRIEANTLLVEGRIAIGPQEQMEPLYADVRATLFRRSFALSNELQTEKIEAQLRDGVLTVRIPKRAELQPRRIEVSTA